MTMTQQTLQKFFDERPALSKRMVAIESGIAPRTLVYALSEGRITPATVEALLPILKKYGYKFSGNG